VALQASGMPPRPRRQPLVFDTCRFAVVWRVMLFVQVLLAVGALPGVADGHTWLWRLALFTGLALPAALLWLLLLCALKRRLSRWPLMAQVGLASGLGGLLALGGSGLMGWVGLMGSVQGLASAAAGTLVAAVVVGALVWRAQALVWQAQAMVPASTQAQLAELQARIRPHFLFNTLNSAIALVREEPAKAERLLEDLSELFRHALADTQAAVPLSQELELARHYLAIEQVRFGERLKIEWRLDPDAAQAMLPPLILQPLVKNAVKHGVEPSPHGARVRISTQRRGPVVVIKVTNTVPHGSGPRGHGLALDNVRQRLRLLHDAQGLFKSGLVNGVFQVRLVIPV
jgi:two-component system sensor histidine kinase AlgZ